MIVWHDPDLPSKIGAYLSQSLPWPMAYGQLRHLQWHFLRQFQLQVGRFVSDTVGLTAGSFQVGGDWNMFQYFAYLGNFIIPIDFHSNLFQRGGSSTTNQSSLHCQLPPEVARNACPLRPLVGSRG